MMKKIFKWILIIFVLLMIVAVILYKFNPTINLITKVTLMNMKKITEFEVRNTEVYMNNIINSKTYKQFKTIMETNPQVTTLIEEKVNGSINDDTMIKLAYYIRKKGLNTKLLSYSAIDSGGVDLFLAGVERTMEKGAHIGVHSWSDGIKEATDFPKSAEEHEQNRKYIEDMLGKDDFYWFTIHAAPANNIYEMSEEEIKKYGLLTKPIIAKKLLTTDKYTGVFKNKVGEITIGNKKASTVIVNVQGGPILYFDIESTYHMFVEKIHADLDKILILNVHQEQTIMPWKFDTKKITFEQAKKYDKLSVKRLVDVINYLKKQGKKVYVVGISFGAFIVEDSIAEYGNIADKYLIMVGRLNMPKEVWSEFSKGDYVGFEYSEDGKQKIVPFNAEQAGMGGSSSIADQNMAKLAAGLGYKRYMTLLKNVDLSNMLYAYGKTDEQIGALTKEEIDFLRSKGVKILEGNGNHEETVYEFIKEVVEFFDISTNPLSPKLNQYFKTK